MRSGANGKLCCVECFRHPWLRDHITKHALKRGNCQYCGARRRPRRLGRYFRRRALRTSGDVHLWRRLRAYHDLQRASPHHGPGRFPGVGRASRRLRRSDRIRTQRHWQISLRWDNNPALWHTAPAFRLVSNSPEKVHGNGCVPSAIPSVAANQRID
jgi:hypothetical protein